MAPTIKSGFIKCGIWNPSTFKPDVTALDHLFVCNGEVPDLTTVIQSFDRKQRSLLRSVDVEEEGRIRVCTRSGAHVTADVVLESLKKRDDRKKQASSKRNSSTVSEECDVNEGVQALRRYAELADGRHDLRKRLRASRGLRLASRRVRGRSGHLNRAPTLEKETADARSRGYIFTN